MIQPSHITCRRVLVVVVALIARPARFATAAIMVHQNKFADDLVERLYVNRNECSSALGLSLALSLVYPSMAPGSQAKLQTETLLGFQTGRYMFEEFQLSKHQSTKRAPSVSLAYSVWVDQTKPLNPEYASSAVAKHLHQHDFQSSHAGDAINAWVKKATAGRIDSIVPSGAIQGDLVAVSAIYLKATWKHTFKSMRTSLDNFYARAAKSLDDIKRVPFMHQVESFPYSEVDDYQLLQLPLLESDTLTMVLALPMMSAPSDESPRFTSQKLVASLPNLQKRAVALALPKFEFTASYGRVLESALQSLGWDAAFRGGLAVYDASVSRVGAILQKTFFRVDEDGVEAAAVTAIMTRSLKRPPVDPPVLFQADHPFQFFLLDGKTVLFEGRVGDPLWQWEEEPTGTSHESKDYWSNGFGVETPIKPGDNAKSCDSTYSSSLE